MTMRHRILWLLHTCGSATGTLFTSCHLRRSHRRSLHRAHLYSALVIVLARPNAMNVALAFFAAFLSPGTIQYSRCSLQHITVTLYSVLIVVLDRPNTINVTPVFYAAFLSLVCSLWSFFTACSSSYWPGQTR